MLDQSTHNQKDHDILIRLDQKVSDLQQAVKDLNDGTVSKIAMLEKDKANRKEIEELQRLVNDNIEIRIRKLENKTANYAITFTLYSIAVAFMIVLIIYHLIGK